MSPEASPPAISSRCPCLSGFPYAECCRRLHNGETHAATAEQLMRSRYSAFAIGDNHYLLDTWHPATRPAELSLDPSLRWYRLDILAVADGGVLDTRGNVEFRAYYRSPAGPGEQHELSRFVKQHNRWFYLDEAV